MIPSTTLTGSLKTSCGRRLAFELLEGRQLLSAAGVLQPGALVSPWQNPRLTMDVNNDGITNDDDVLDVVDRLIAVGSGPLPTNVDQQTPHDYYDTNGDTILSPIDALRIIHRLLTPPVVSLDTLVPFTVDLTPRVSVTATSPASLPDGTQVKVDIDFNGDGNFTDPGESGSSLTSLFGGSSTFDITPGFAPDDPNVGAYQVNLRARVIDSDGVEGTSPVVPLTIDTATSSALTDYVNAPDPSYHYSLANTIVDPNGQFTAYMLDMTSQTWRTSADVNLTTWHHWLQVVVPTGTIGTTALLYITGGANTDPVPTSFADPSVVSLAVQSHTVTAELFDVPSEPLTFTGDPNNPREEDAILAYTFDQFMKNIGQPGNDTWPALLPMVKSAVRAMDTVQSFVPTVANNSPIADFVVTGYSKRGWTTWLTAAVDDRVKAIIPGAFDALNLTAQMVHHYEVYGFFSPAVQDYIDLNIFQRLTTSEGEQLDQIIDPYRYLNNGRFTIPKLLIDSAGDPFFVSDSAQFYFHDLPGTQNYIRYLPNTNHSLDSRADDSTASFYDAILNNRPLPQFSWTVEPDGSIRVQTVDTPTQVLLWQITNPDARDFRKDFISPSLVWTSSPLTDQGGGVYIGSTPMPASGATAFMVELTFPSGIPGNPFVFTTEIHVNTALPLFAWPYPSGLAVAGDQSPQPAPATVAIAISSTTVATASAASGRQVNDEGAAIRQSASSTTNSRAPLIHASANRPTVSRSVTKVQNPARARALDAWFEESDWRADELLPATAG